MGELRDSTVRSRELGLALRRTTQAKGFNGKDLARAMGWSRTKMSNLFQGVRGASPTDVAGILGKCDVTGPKREELLEMAEDSLKLGWWQEYEGRLPADLWTLSDQEDAAIEFLDYHSTTVPGLLQTESYARARFDALPYVPKKEIDERVKVRKKRHHVFDRHYPPKCRFFIDEYVLSRTGLGREIMSDQVHHLLRMAVRPYVEIRIIPEAVGLHGGQEPFHLMEFTEFKPVTFIEHATTALFLEQEETTATDRLIEADLDKVALDEARSREWLASLASALEHPREEPDHAPDLAEEFIHRR